MSKAKETALAEQRVSSLALPEAPSFMEKDGTMGTEYTSTKVRPPFLKLIQKQSSDELISTFGMGSAILTPDRLLVLTVDGPPVRIVPIFAFSEYLKLAPIALKDTEAMIKERSLDPNSDLGRRCTDPARWYEDHPNHPGDQKFQYRNAEAMNFMCMFREDHLDIGMPFVISFMKGSYGKGQQFCNTISMRKRPPFGCIFELSIDPVLGKNASGEWRRFLIQNPGQDPWVQDEAEYNIYKELHERFAALHATDDIDVTHDQNDEVVQESSAGGDTGNY